jgi:hypothetical protein
MQDDKYFPLRSTPSMTIGTLVLVEIGRRQEVIVTSSFPGINKQIVAISGA